MAEEPKTPTPAEVEAASIDLNAIPEDVKKVLFHQENRIRAIEDLFLQAALDLKTLATVLNALQVHVPGMKHEAIRRDLEEVHAKWLGLLKQAEAAGRIKFSRPSSLIVPAGVKPN